MRDIILNKQQKTRQNAAFLLFICLFLYCISRISVDELFRTRIAYKHFTTFKFIIQSVS